MKKQLLKLFLASSLFISTYSAFGHDLCMDGWYGALSGGLSYHRDSKISNFTIEDETATFDHKTGFGMNMAIGYMVDTWRIELEASYRRSKNENICAEDVFSQSPHDDRGYIQNFALMVNAFYDFYLSDCFSIFIGGGIGASDTRFSYSFIDTATDCGESSADCVPLVCGSDNEWNFAWQLMAGFAYHINDCWALTVGYRFFSTAKPTMCLARISAEECCNKFCDMPYSNNVDFGVRVRF